MSGEIDIMESDKEEITGKKIRLPYLSNAFPDLAVGIENEIERWREREREREKEREKES
jgi:hypothetical protein